jgi:hypothetical protein
VSHAQRISGDVFSFSGSDDDLMMRDGGPIFSDRDDALHDLL